MFTLILFYFRRISGKLIISTHDRENGSYEKRNEGCYAKTFIEAIFTDNGVIEPIDEPCE